MNLLVIRHARAESVKEFAKTGVPDDERPLTDDGRARMRLGAAGLHRLVETIDVLASSPLVRARQTAEIVAAEFETPDIIVLDELRQETPPTAFAQWLKDAGERETVAIVGHDRHLRVLVTWLLTGQEKPILDIKKGAAVLLELKRRRRRAAAPRSARLLWSLAPRQLRMLGAGAALPSRAGSRSLQQPAPDAQGAE